MPIERSRSGRSRCLHSQRDRLARCRRVDLVDLGSGAGEADAKALDLPKPALALGLGDPVEEVVADLHEPTALCRVGRAGLLYVTLAHPSLAMPLTVAAAGVTIVFTIAGVLVAVMASSRR
ncbi:hypothetical protein ACFXD5_15540 [Streptomyces sp. NPDC059385]|uniref:hypothetical protein n=1 Tax=Streptomyces sp. NPDC059385 TaxID=3346817 RepID=UPI00367F31DF